MLTLITGGRNYEGLFSVTAHELAHSWFQHVLATNETKHEWMDEGFTTFISSLAGNQILDKGLDFPLEGSYRGYFSLASLGGEMPQSTNANRYHHNYAYERTAYSKGAVFLGQLAYLIGYENLFKVLRTYFDEWKFKHPLPNDFRRIAERVSGLQLQWYLTDWTQTTNKIDYILHDVVEYGSSTLLKIKRKELMPMPLEILVLSKNGDRELHYIPISLMRGEKLNQYDKILGVLNEGLGPVFDDTLILTLTEFGRKIEENGGYGTEHVYGTAILMAGGLLKKAQIFADWPGLKSKNLFEGQDLNATIDARAVYCSAMSACFEVDFSYMRKQAFWDHSLPDLTDKLFKV